MDSIEIKLYRKVQKYRHLYYSLLKEYRDFIGVRKSCLEIAENLVIDIDAAKKKWKYIKDYFYKSKRTAKGIVKKVSSRQHDYY